MKRKLTLVLAGLLATGLIAAGCGDDDDESSDTGTDTVTALSKADFIQQADAICQQSNQEIDQAGKQLGESSSAAEVDAYVTDTIVPGIQSQIDDIKALGAPEGDEAQVDAILAAAQKANDELKADPAQLRNQNADPFAEANKLAQDYGLTVCGQG